MGTKEQGYKGKSTIDYLPLKNYVVLEGIRKSPSGIIIPDTANVDSEKFDRMVVVALGPRCIEEGLEIGDAVSLDPRLTGFGLMLPDELCNGRHLLEYELTAIRGIIPKRAIKRMENEDNQFKKNFTIPADGKPKKDLPN